MAKQKKKIQEFIPGIGPKKNERIHAAALDYHEEMLARVAATAKETEAQDRLIDIMHDEGVKVYTYGELSVTLANSGKEKANVKIKEESSEKPKKGKKAKDGEE